MHSFAAPAEYHAKTATAMPDELKERYRTGREELRAISKRLESTIAARLTRSAADREKKLSKGDGGKLLKALHGLCQSLGGVTVRRRSATQCCADAHTDAYGAGVLRNIPDRPGSPTASFNPSASAKTKEQAAFSL